MNERRINYFSINHKLLVALVTIIELGTRLKISGIILLKVDITAFIFQISTQQTYSRPYSS